MYPHDNPDIMKPAIRRFDSIDDEIANDVDLISRNRISRLYDVERYKCLDHSIAILFPVVEHPSAANIIKSRDSMRFLLSLYPEKKDLRAIDRIIMRPRHIEAGGIELMALYIRASKTLVHYLYAPHSYDIGAMNTSVYNEQTAFEINRVVNRNVKHIPRDEEHQVQPLLYILSLIDIAGNPVDKFFVKTDPNDNAGIISQINDVSDYYARHGY